MTTEEFIEKLAEVKMTFFITAHESIRTKEEVTVRYADGEGSRRCLCPIEALWYHMSREGEALFFSAAATALGLSRLDMWLIVDTADTPCDVWRPSEPGVLLLVDFGHSRIPPTPRTTLRQSLLSTLTFENAS